MSSAQFWGIEVEGKVPQSVYVVTGQVIHISQATLTDVKKDDEPVVIHVKVGDKKLVMGILSQKTTQLSFDLVFDEDFEISHNLKNGSIHLLGYTQEFVEFDEEVPSDFDESDEDEEIVDVPDLIPVSLAGKLIMSSKDDAKDKKLIPEDSDDDESDSDDDEDDSDDDSSDDDDIPMLGGIDEDDDSDDDSDSSSSEEDETPKVVESGKKRSKPDANAPEPKKAKLAIQQKTEEKKGGNTATPKPSNKAEKTQGGNKSNPKKSGGKSFGSHKK